MEGVQASEFFNVHVFAYLFLHGVFSFVVFSLLIGLIRAAGHLRRNFRGEEIPASAGIGFVLLSLSSIFWGCVVEDEFIHQILAIFLIISFGFGLLGMLDDFLVVREKGGLTGHLGALRRTGVFSTALFKAFFGLLLCVYVFGVFGGSKGWGLVVDVLVVAMGANAINLLDVKAGRALKGFWLFLILLILSGFLSVNAAFPPFFLPVLGLVFISSIVYARWDLECRAMMGDAGSNVLGAVLGLGVVWGLPFPGKVAALGVLIMWHLIAEFYSISKVIEAVGPLRWLDNLGVGRDEK